MIRARRAANRHIGRVMLIALAALLVTGCTSGGSTEPTVSPTVPPTTTLGPTPPMSMGDVTWATALDSSGGPADPASEIARDVDTIYAVAQLQGVQPGTTFSATWSIDGIPIDRPLETVVVDSGAASGWISFALAWNGAALWPVGELGVTIAADSGDEVSGIVRIVST